MGQEDKQVWGCEFCCAENEVMLDEEEMPKANAVNYLVEAPAQVLDKKLQGQDISVVFCLDVSGSMCVSEPVKGKLNIKGDRSQKDREALKNHIEHGANQFLQSEKNVTYVSRI